MNFHVKFENEWLTSSLLKLYLTVKSCRWVSQSLSISSECKKKRATAKNIPSKRLIRSTGGIYYLIYETILPARTAHTIQFGMHCITISEWQHKTRPKTKCVVGAWISVCGVFNEIYYTQCLIHNNNISLTAAQTTTRRRRKKRKTITRLWWIAVFAAKVLSF